ncbi:MAG: hypothetical protein R6V19_10835 [Armatimonadota bacterium]
MMGQYHVFFVTGEPSGDLHAAGLAQKLVTKGDVRLEAVGGRHLSAAGAKLFIDSSDWGAIGVAQAIMRLPTYLSAMRRLVRRLKENPPDLLVPVDFGAFNIRLLKRLEHSGLPPVLYYFPPGSWSRKPRDNSDLARLVDRVATPFPWSEQILQKEGLDAHFVGHPVVDRIQPPPDREQFRKDLGLRDAQFYLGMMPGSRAVERRLLAPEMVGAANMLSQRGFDVHALYSPPPRPGATDDSSIAKEQLGDRVTVIADSAELVNAADLLLTAFGTATLEASAALCPMIGIYRGTPGMWLQYHLFGLSTDTYAMPNLIAGKHIVPETIDPSETRADGLADRVQEYIEHPQRLQQMRDDLARVRDVLGDGGAHQAAADLAWDMLNSRDNRPTDTIT